MVRIFAENKRSPVDIAFQNSRRIVGYPSPEYVASQLISENHPLHAHVQREMYFHPTQPFLFFGTRFVMKQLLRKGESVALWTDEYVERVNSSGLRDLQRYGDLSFILSETKEDIIPDLFLHARERGASELIVVDNQLSKLQAVQRYAQEYPDISLHTVLVGKRKRDKKGELESEVLEIPNIWSTRRIARRLVNEKRLWVFDFNDTLMDQRAYEKSLERSVHSLVRRFASFR